MDPIDAEGHLIIDFSIYDAIKAGFGKVIFVIKKQMEEDFKNVIGDRISKHIEVEYVFQQLGNVPKGYEVPEGREKPWGTGHAVMSCINHIDGPFAVINADDFYGASAFEKICSYLKKTCDDDKYRYTMVGYILENTLTENGYVARGVCCIDENDMLVGIHERTRIEKHGSAVEYTEDDGNTWVSLSPELTVSMNMWGFGESVLKELTARFPLFLENDVPKNKLKAEYFLPTVVNQLIREDKATVKVLKSMDKWYGVTYKEDKGTVMEAIETFKNQRIYPVRLWE